jgi:hypothetical protein
MGSFFLLGSATCAAHPSVLRPNDLPHTCGKRRKRQARFRRISKPLHGLRQVMDKSLGGATSLRQVARASRWPARSIGCRLNRLAAERDRSAAD